MIEQDTETVCTGVRLDEKWVTLRASCIQGKTIQKSQHKYKVAIGHLDGDVGEQLRSISKVVIHPEFERRNKRRYDIALIKLAGAPEAAEQYSSFPCIVSEIDLTRTIKEFKVGMITYGGRGEEWLDVTSKKIKLAPKLCSSGKYICSRFVKKSPSTQTIRDAPIYVRLGIRDTDWGLAGLTTAEWRRTRSGNSIIHKHTPLYSYINWFDYVMGKEDKFYS